MRTRLTTLTLTLVLGAGASAFAQEPTPQTPPAAQTPATPAPAAPAEPAIGFTSDAGMMFNVIKSTATADFEMVIGRLREALHKSENPARKQQAANWTVYKSTDPSPDG